MRGFLPASLVDIRRVQDLDEFLGRKLECKVIELNRNRNNVVLSRRAVLEDERREVRQKILDELQPGQVVEGVISNIVEFGAFVDLDGIDGLIHISELSWSHVNHPSEVLQIGEKVRVKVLDIDRDRQRISLGLKQTQADPWQSVIESYQVGDVVEGRVTKVVTFGAFVEIHPGVEGLVHISELAAHHVENPREVVNQGDVLAVRVIEIDADRRRLSLSLKRVADSDPIQHHLPDDVRPPVDPPRTAPRRARRRDRTRGRGRTADAEAIAVAEPAHRRGRGRRRGGGAPSPRQPPRSSPRPRSRRSRRPRPRPSIEAEPRSSRSSRRQPEPEVEPRPTPEPEAEPDAEPEPGDRGRSRRPSRPRSRRQAARRRADAEPRGADVAGGRRAGAPLLALTGGIGSGKSEALAAFAALRRRVLSSDAVVHAALRATRGRRGGRGPLRRRRDRRRRRRRPAPCWARARSPRRAASRFLEALLHPRVGAGARAWIADQRRADPPPPLLVCEVPLLFEAGAEGPFDAVLVVTAPDDVRRARVEARGQDFAARGAPPAARGGEGRPRRRRSS